MIRPLSFVSSLVCMLMLGAPASAQQAPASVVAPATEPPEEHESVERMEAAEQSAPMLTEAQSHFRVALTFYQENRFLEAAREFEESYRLSNHPDVLYNIYVSYRDAGDWVAAARSLRMYLDRSPQTLPQRTSLEARLVAIEHRLAELENQIAARQAAANAAANPQPAPVAATQADRDTGPRSPHWSGYVTVSVGAAALVAGTVTGFLAMSQVADLKKACPDGECPPSAQSDYDRVHALTTATDALLISGGLVALAGTAMVLFFKTPDSPVTPSAACDGQGCAASLRVRF